MEAITQPLQLVRSLYAARSDADGEDYGVEARFAALVADPQLCAQVPVLTEDTAELVPNQCLVRFRGMVVDMLNPEYYVGEFRRPDGTWHTAKYADQLDEAVPQGGETRIAERRPVLLVPVPAESEWVAAPLAAAARASLAALNPGAAAGANASGNGSASQGGSAAPKRAREDGGAELAAAGDDVSMSMMVSDATGQTGVDDGDSAASRARRAGATGAAAGAQGPGRQQEEATSGAAAGDLPAGCCMAYVYGDQELKLNDVVEVVGILSRVPELAAAHMQQQEEGQESMLVDDILASHLPTSKVPRLHAILLKTDSDSGPAAAPALSAADLAAARARVLGFLSMVLGGDDLAAEYLLLQLVGRVQHRTAESAVGVLCLNLVAELNSPAAAAAAGVQQQQQQQAAQAGVSPLGAALAAAVGSLAPRCLALPLSIAALNRRPWWPRRDQNTQRLISGPLQLAPNTQVVLDETVMAAGSLNEVGLRNLAALQTLMARQKVGYDFEFFSLDQPADAPVTVLSLGRSLLKEAVGVTLPLRPTAPLADAASVAAAATSADLDPLRAYLAAVRCTDFAIAPDTEVFLQQELAGARQKDREVNERTFHAWMNLARLLAVSHGEATLTRERWAAMQALESRRQQRLHGGVPAGAQV